MDSIANDTYFCDHFALISEIGEGAFSKVYRCQNKSSKEETAVKVISKSGLSKARANQIRSEAQILGDLDHPNIVRLIQFFESPYNFMLEMELLRGGTLESHLQSSCLTDEDSSRIMKDIMSAVSYLHDSDIIHRDIKPENIMLIDETLKEVKLADFGLSLQCTSDKGADENCGTALYMAPEQAVKRVYNKPVDIWSCGIVMYKLITGTHPLSSPQDTVESYFNKLKNVKWKFPTQFSEMAQDLFRRLTRTDPLERYSANMALRHPWITRKAEMPAPMTYLEKLNFFNDKLKARRIVNSIIILSVIRGKDPIGEKLVRTGEMPKIHLGFSANYRENHKRTNTSVVMSHRSPSPAGKKTVRLNSLKRKYTFSK